MQLFWGTFGFAANQVTIADRREQDWSDGGRLLSYKRSMDVEGYLLANGQAATTLVMSALMQALSFQGHDLILKQDTGANSATLLRNAGSITGTRVVKGPDFPESKDGISYVSGRKFTFTVEAVYPYSGTGNFLRSFHETLSFSGGKPLYVARPALNTVGQIQRVWFQMPYRCIQKGFAVGYGDYPPLPLPKFPGALLEAPEPVKHSPRRMGGLANLGYQDFKIEWVYKFGSVLPLSQSVNPTLWDDLE